MSIVARVVLGFVIAVLLVAAIGGVSYRNTRRLLEAAEWVQHTQRVLNSLGAVLSDEQDLETGQRGFILTGEQRYLEPYAAGLEAITRNLRELRDSTSDNRNQQRRLDRLEPLLSAKHAELAETIALRRMAGLNAAVDVVLTDRGKNIMDEIRLVLAEMEAEERTLLDVRGAQSASDARRATLTIILGSIIGVLVLAVISAFTIPRVVGIDQDITARKQAEVALEKERRELERRVAERTADLSLANAELAATSRAKDEFLANMSHELRTPLTAILGTSESLQEAVYGPLNANQQESVRRVEESGRHLLSLINDILDLSKAEAGKLELELGVVDVREICEVSMRFVKETAYKKRLKITTSIDHQVTTVNADARRLKQILVNLLTNAVKFTPEGGRVGLEVIGDADQEVVRLSVWDTGIGISPEQMTDLFKPFVQLDTGLDRQYEGTGLGLSLVSRMVELHGGSVTVDSAGEGEGSRFTVALPWSPATMATVDPEEADAPPAPIHRALVVEDSPSAAELLERYLKEMDVSCTVLDRAERVLEVATKTRPDVILLDLLLPDESGWDVLAKLTADPRTRDIPIMIVSVVDERVRGLELGARGYLLKPFTRDQLRAALETSVGGRDIPMPTSALVVPAKQKSEDAPLILIAEDNDANIRSISGYLVAKGFRLAVARNGGEAVDQTRELRPDLILMDIQMPGLDGLEATRQIRKDPEFSSLPIIALTALAMPGDRERTLEAGANEYMAKPVSLRALVETMGELLGRPAK